MRQCCPLCLADTCPETRPDCRARAEQIRDLYDRANGPGEPRAIIVPPAVLARVLRVVRKTSQPRRRSPR